jgi:hypothetical protein
MPSEGAPSRFSILFTYFIFFIPPKENENFTLHKGILGIIN